MIDEVSSREERDTVSLPHFVATKLIQFARRRHEQWFFRTIFNGLISTDSGRDLVLWTAEHSDATVRSFAARALVRAAPTLVIARALAERARRRLEGSSTMPRLQIALGATIEAQQFAEGRKILEATWVNKFRDSPEIFDLAIALHSELAEHQVVTELVNRVMVIEPEKIRARYHFLKASYGAAISRDGTSALEFFGRQFGFLEDGFEYRENQVNDQVWKSISLHLITLLQAIILLRMMRSEKTKIGVFFLSSTEALGHAVLDPYHFLALNKGRFDQIFFIGPPRESYRPGSAACLKIVEQYGQYLVTHDNALLNLSWMALGEYTFGDITMCVDNYWTLLRDATHRTRDPGNSFQHNTWHFDLPTPTEVDGLTFIKRNKIDMNRSIVVVHIRERSYHHLSKQSYRDADVLSYANAIKFLLSQGKLVIRIGDKKMQRLEIENPNYIELPFARGYRSTLDSFFIAKCEFMIGCQSGPCAYARAFGRPILSVNAVYHYTLLPSTLEMACFKRYLRADGTMVTPVEAIQAHMFHLETAEQFEAAGITLESCSSEEVLAAVKEMLDWLAAPDRPETDAQRAFRMSVDQVATEIKDSMTIKPLIADYIGFVLPGYRISDAVTRLRGQAPAA